MKQRAVKTLDIVDPIPDSPDPTTFVSEKTGKGKLEKGWIVCSFHILQLNLLNLDL